MGECFNLINLNVTTGPSRRKLCYKCNMLLLLVLCFFMLNYNKNNMLSFFFIKKNQKSSFMLSPSKEQKKPCLMAFLFFVIVILCLIHINKFMVFYANGCLCVFFLFVLCFMFNCVYLICIFKRRLSSDVTNNQNIL